MKIESREAKVGGLWARIGAVFFVALLLAGCGFQVRGPLALPFKNLYLAMPEQSDMGVALRRQVLASGTTTLADDRESADAVFSVVLENREKSILSLNAAGRVREFRLRQRFAFRLQDTKGHDLLPPTELQVTRDMAYSDSYLLSKGAEEALLYQDMQNDLVQQIIRRLSVAKTRTD